MFKTYLIQYFRTYDLVCFLAHLGLEIAVKVVRYEDLVANMVNVTCDLYKFAGLGWSSNVVKWISTLDNNSKHGRAHSVLRNVAIHKIMTCEMHDSAWRAFVRWLTPKDWSAILGAPSCEETFLYVSPLQNC